jgi:hypothetical protein
MIRRLVLLALLLSLGCQVPAERVQVMPLPADGQPLAYADVVQRARAQATTANEAFYVDKWAELSAAATGIEESAGLLRKAHEVPAARQASLAADADELAQRAGQLREAAGAKDVPRVNQLLQQINLKVRELRPAERGAP